MDLKPLSLTYVLYDPEDVLSLAFAVSAMVPFAILISLATLAYTKRELTWLTLLAGMLANEASNALLKRLVAQPRPQSVSSRGGHGWPSSHAQFQAFFAACLSLLLLSRYWRSQAAASAMRVLGLWLLAAFVAAGRVYLHFHSVAQVAAGLVIGFFLGVVWYLVYCWSVSAVYPWLEAHPVAVFLRLRDSSSLYAKGILVEEQEYELCRRLRGKPVAR